MLMPAKHEGGLVPHMQRTSKLQACLGRICASRMRQLTGPRGLAEQGCAGQATHRIMPPNSKRRPFAKVEVASESAGEILSGYCAYMPSSYLNNLQATHNTRV